MDVFVFGIMSFDKNFSEVNFPTVRPTPRSDRATSTTSDALTSSAVLVP